jgi:hypothetical protein
MSIWYAMPSGDHVVARECGRQWQARGFKVAVMFDDDEPLATWADLCLHTHGRFPGYAKATNRLISECIARGATHAIGGNDDMFPRDACDPATLTSLWGQRFGNSTLGVMQPTGDMWGGMPWSAIVPVIGREYAERINNGRGVYWPEYFSLYSDTELHDVARKLGLYYTEPGVTIYHDHHTRRGSDQLPAVKREAQQREACGDRTLYERRVASAFPGHELRE